MTNMLINSLYEDICCEDLPMMDPTEAMDAYNQWLEEQYQLARGKVNELVYTYNRLYPGMFADIHDAAVNGLDEAVKNGCTEADEIIKFVTGCILEVCDD